MDLSMVARCGCNKRSEFSKLLVGDLALTNKTHGTKAILRMSVLTIGDQEVKSLYVLR